MLDKETRNRIDDLRQILVGKVTDPRSQVEQITNALLYKFMNDMDEYSVKMGGVPSYFINKYEKYSWKNLMDKKTSGEERVNLYSNGLEKMYLNENLPETFREIFKNSTLSFKEPKIFNKFILRINDFKYSNSESLGDAFEYLLSFMGTQGEAGQFRTPRHIINFIVDIVDPKKNENILDPASGTAGFLISAYKHILNQNKKKIPGDLLNSSDRKNISKNLNGYDISPEFLKVSLMNMFLHKFSNPNIFEYDTLSSDDKWNEYFDIVLANPPFFTPKGGITPHNRFGVKSKKAEVLFTDYINEHLKPNGRAGIIVPEGIVFRNNGGFQSVRKKLLETSLIGVISLPAGVFEPYSNVKTSILILDKKEFKKRDYIYFAKINSDGYTLTTNRTPTEKNDIPNILKKIKKQDFSKEDDLKKIYKSSIINSNIREHIPNEIENFERKINFVRLGEVCNISSGNSAPQGEKYFKDGKFPFIRTSDVGAIKIGDIYDTKDHLNELGIKKLTLHEKGGILFPKSGASTLLNHRVMMKTNAYVSSHLAILKAKKDLIHEKFLFYMLQNIDAKDYVPNPSYPSLNLNAISEIEIPIPNLDIQLDLVKKLDRYSEIINSAKKIIDNFKPNITIKKDWKLKKIKDLCEINPKSKFNHKDNNSLVNFIPMEDVDANQMIIKSKKERKISEVIKGYTQFQKDDILLAKITPCFENGKCGIINELNFKLGFGSTEFIVIRCLDKIARPEWIYCFIVQDEFKRLGIQNFTGTSGHRRVPKDFVQNYEIPITSIEEQDEILKPIIEENQIVQNNFKLIKNYNYKIENILDDLWK